MVEHDTDANETHTADTALSDRDATLVEALLSGSHRALARVISRIEDRAPGYRAIVSALHDHTGSADVIGITGSPGAGKSTLSTSWRSRSATAVTRSGSSPSTPPRRTPAGRSSATGSGWPRPSATWTSSSAR